VAFAGSAGPAARLDRALAEADGPIRPLILYNDGRGNGVSGAAPLAGGPHYLQRFTTEHTLTINTTAAGGNASLLSLGEGHAP
jgi:hypothetical protein